MGKRGDGEEANGGELRSAEEEERRGKLREEEERRSAKLLRWRGEVGVLARMLGACVLAFPYDMPAWVPEALRVLSQCTVTGGMQKWQEVRNVVTSTINDFKRAHTDNWDRLQLRFTPEQLEALGGAETSPHYYA